MDRYYKKRFVPLALPALILFVMVIVIPFIMGVIYSFTAWRGTYFAGGDHFWEAFVGFDNYVKAFKTKKFLDAFVYTSDQRGIPCNGASGNQPEQRRCGIPHDLLSA